MITLYGEFPPHLIHGEQYSCQAHLQQSIRIYTKKSSRTGVWIKEIAKLKKLCDLINGFVCEASIQIGCHEGLPINNGAIKPFDSLALAKIKYWLECITKQANVVSKICPSSIYLLHLTQTIRFVNQIK